MPARATVDERLRRIESVTDAALAQLDVDDLLAELLDRVCELLNVDTATVLLLDDSSQYLMPASTRGAQEEIGQGIRIPVGKYFAGRVAAEQRPVVIEQVKPGDVINPILIEQKIQSLLGVPLLVGRNLLGVLHVGSRPVRRFYEEDIRLLQLVADRLALAIHVRQSDVERRTAEALQRSLVPSRLPILPGLDLAARYIPGQGNGVGGDWYDLFVLPSGWQCMVIGDVVGHGLRAAVIMGRLRSALRAYALEGGDPAEVLSKLDHKVLHFEPGAMATVLYAKFEPGQKRLHLSSAGHLPPVLATPDGKVTMLDLPIDPPLGVRLGLRRRTTVLEVMPGWVLCFYTDGLVERRGSSIDQGLRRLCASVTPGPAESVCTTVMRGLIGSETVGDDVAVLVVRREESAQLAPLELVLPAVPRSSRDIRQALRQWLSAARATEEDATDILIVVGEAVSNAIEHAYGPRGGDIEVRLELTPPDVLITIRDHGHWRPQRGQGRGHGIGLIQQCSDEVRFDRGQSGTTVRIRRRLPVQGS